MTRQSIVVRGARQHNLKNIDLEIPRRRFVVITGPSGSGKSSLAFDTIYAEGQRRYVESLSTYAKQFLERMEKPDVDRVDGISPSVAIEQRNPTKTSRSTVGTATEVHDYLRLLWARVGKIVCPGVPGDPCDRVVEPDTVESATDRVLQLPEGARVMIAFPLPLSARVTHALIVENLRALGFLRVLARGEEVHLDDLPEEIDLAKSDPYVIVDRLRVDPEERSRLADSLQTAFQEGDGDAAVFIPGSAGTLERLDFTERFRCPRHPGIHFPAPSPQLFSFNNPYGSCPECTGFGAVLTYDPQLIVPNPARSLAEGAVDPWDKPRYDGRRKKLADFARVNEVSMDAPWSALPEPFRNAVIEGTRGFEGVIPFLVALEEKRYKQYIRVFLRQYQSALPCPSCEGSKLRPEALRVQVAGFSIAQVSGMPLAEVGAWLASLGGSGDRVSRSGDRVPSGVSGGSGERVSRRGRGENDGGAEGSATRLDSLPSGDSNKKNESVPEIEPGPAGSPVSDPETNPTGRAGTDHRAVLSAPPSFSPRPLRETRSPAPSDVPEGARSPEMTASGAAGTLSDRDREVAGTILRELHSRVGFLNDVGVGYLTLDRQTRTLSGGEAQRISLANALGGTLVDTIYVLDEPTIGLHPADTDRLLRLLLRLRDGGNSVLVVEHDPAAMRVADHLVELGPGSGEQGGRVVFTGTLDEILTAGTLTGRYLSGEEVIPIPERRRLDGIPWIRVNGAREHNLQGIDVRFPLRAMTVVTGVSGSGKSTLVHDVIYRALERALSGGETSAKRHLGESVGRVESIVGAERVKEVVLVDQSPIGRTPRSNPVSYIKAYDEVRKIFAALPESRRRGYTASDFSFNVEGGRCEACKGEGQVEVEMVFMADVFIPCEVCGGSRFKPELLEVKYLGRGTERAGGANIADVLAMTVDEAIRFFLQEDRLGQSLWHLQQVGLGYLRLGQPAPTLSGGEAQRIKIARELALGARRGGHKLYILDEPTTGLHMDDVRKLLRVLHDLVDAGHAVLIIEHNLDVIRSADWVIDLGPGAGPDGGRVVAMGSPEEVAKVAESLTGKAVGNSEG